MVTFFVLSILIFHAGYLSPRELADASTLDDVAFYSQQEIEAAEKRDGIVYHKAKHMKESVEDILIAGYDPTFIIKQGPSCDIKWMLQEEKEEFLREMDNIAGHPLRQDYRSLAEALDVPTGKVQALESRGQDSVTEGLLQYWNQRTRRRMTLGMMLTLLTHPGLVDNEKASTCVEDVLERLGHKV